MAKKVLTVIKLQIPGGQANPAPPVGPALGQHGVNIMEFCKAFNAQTQKIEPGLPLPVVITAYADKSFSFIIKTPPTTVLIKKAAGIESGSPRPHTDKVGKSTRKQVEEIAKAKMPDLPIDSVRKVPYGPLVEVVVGGNEIVYTDEKASFTSTRSTSPIDFPAFSSACAPAFAGVRARYANSSAT